MRLLLLSALLVSAVLAAEPAKQQQSQHESSLKQQQQPKQAEPAAATTTAADESSSSQESEEYRALAGEEVKQLLLKVVDENIDKDHDQRITAEELKNWLSVLQERVIQDNVNRQWAYYHPETEEVLSWDSYYPEQKQVVSWQRYLNYTYPDEALEPEASSKPELAEVISMMKRAERRWKNADVDGDGSLAKEEFRDFIHPEESPRAAGVAVAEAMEDMDADKDGKIALKEYMNHLYKVSGEEKEDPSWSSAQESHFVNFLDKDRDGSLSGTEMKEWVVPSYDRSEAEAWRLISIADRDQDGTLARQDIADYHEYFLALLPPEYWAQEDPTEASKHDEF